MVVRSAYCLLLFSLTRCFHYSTSEQTVNAPVLLGIERIASGHRLKVAAQNLEIGFAGYRLYEGASESEARSLDAPTQKDCGPFGTLPAQGVEYAMDIRVDRTTVEDGSVNHLCVFTHAATPGNYVVVRALLLRDLQSQATSIASNALIAP